MIMLSPLRYPGSKADLVPTIAQILINNNLTGCSLIEPYAGSASISLGLVESGIISSSIIGEQDPLLYSFWKSVFENTDDLLEKFIDLPINIETWHRLHPLLKIKNLNEKSDYVELGLAGLFFNRVNFSGILNSGPIGGMHQKSNYKIDCRTNKDDIICRILAISTLHEKITVHFGDAIELINNYKIKNNDIIYADPPYYTQGENLYRYYYKLKDHKLLAEALRKTSSKWLASYDDHPVIESLYEDFDIHRHAFKYSARMPKKNNELLISNFQIHLPLEEWS